MQKITFTLRTNKNPNESTSILIYTRINKQKLLLSARLKVKPKDWNAKEQKVKSQKTIKTHQYLNKQLRAIKKSCEMVIDEMEQQEIPFTKEETKSRLEIVFGWKEKPIPEARYSLFDYFRFYCNRKKQKDGYDNAKIFMNTVKKLENFNPHLDWDDILHVPGYLPPYLLTHLSNSYLETKSSTCDKTVLPVFMT